MYAQINSTSRREGRPLYCDPVFVEELQLEKNTEVTFERVMDGRHYMDVAESVERVMPVASSPAATSVEPAATATGASPPTELPQGEPDTADRGLQRRRTKSFSPGRNAGRGGREPYM